LLPLAAEQAAQRGATEERVVPPAAGARAVQLAGASDERQPAVAARVVLPAAEPAELRAEVQDASAAGRVARLAASDAWPPLVACQLLELAPAERNLVAMAPPLAMKHRASMRATSGEFAQAPASALRAGSRSASTGFVAFAPGWALLAFH
jgi:hypothetical protein